MTPPSLGFRSPAAVAGEAAGSLSLSVARRGDRTHPTRTVSAGVLRLMRALYLDDSGQITYIVINPGGAYFGETYRIDVDVQPGAHLLLANQGATRIYRTPEAPAVQVGAFTVGAGSRLEYMPDQTIAYREADYRQTTTLTVAPDAQAFFGEIITPGWDPEGARFTYAGMRLRIDVHTDGGLVCTDNLRITPATIGPAINGIGYMEGFSHLGSALVLGRHVASPDYTDAVRGLVESCGLDRVGVTAGERHGVAWLMVRALAGSTDALSALLLDLNELDRFHTTGQGRLDLRRY
ncbi:urease accessory protein UreD [Granulicoccus sp. GXG6511]|uniref:urease accessory protein UreD n=1 Tax=Granulicoccus sp. GXG6511 TaxID=3381351 RepID=UPI003D7EA90D